MGKVKLQLDVIGDLCPLLTAYRPLRMRRRSESGRCCLWRENSCGNTGGTLR